MAYQQKDGDIAVFKVKEKKNPKGPDWVGKALIDGVEKDVSFWNKNDTMLAGTIKNKWVPNMQEAKDAVNKAQAPLDDEIPF